MNIRVTYEDDYMRTYEEMVVKTYLFGLIKIKDYVLIEEEFIGEGYPIGISFDNPHWHGKIINSKIIYDDLSNEELIELTKKENDENKSI